MAIKRSPITRVVIIEGAQPNAWTAKVYDSSGLRSGITTGSTREYVERKIAEWFPGVPVEYKLHASKRDPAMNKSRLAKTASGRRELYRRAMQMPALGEWVMFHDPMSNGRRHGYLINFEDRKYVIEPLYSDRGLFLGYGLSFSPGTRGLHARIDRDGLNEIAFNGWVPEYRRPQEAAAVARRFAEREGYA